MISRECAVECKHYWFNEGDCTGAYKKCEDFELHKNVCMYCGGNCPNEPDDSINLCDGFAGDIDNLYMERNEN